MIQRIQSVYLLVGAAVQVMFAFGTYFTYTISGEYQALTGSGFLNEAGDVIEGNSKTLILALISAAAAVGSIFAFKNRKLQIKLANGAAMAVIAEIVFLAISYFKITGNPDAAAEGLSVGFSVFLVPVSAILFWMASKAIKKDDDLVKSVDRIR